MCLITGCVVLAIAMILTNNNLISITFITATKITTNITTQWQYYPYLFMMLITIMMMVTRVINITTTIVIMTIVVELITTATVHVVLAILAVLAIMIDTVSIAQLRISILILIIACYFCCI